MITQTTELNLIPNGSPIRIHVDQYDEGVGRLVFRLYEDDVEYSPVGATAVIQGCKPDGRGFDYNCTLSGNTVTADLTRQMTAVNGSVRSQIVVTESDGRIGSFAFIIEVQRSALPSDTDMSESEYQIIEQAILATQDAVLDAEAWAVGERGGDPVGPSDPTYHNNAEYWAYMASQYAQGGIIYKGSCLFANIPVSGMNNGDMWNIEDDFTTDARFEEGAGIACVAGTNIVWNGSKWDLFAVPKTGVQSFNGRTGIVTPQAGDYDLTDLGDIVITSATDGQVLTWDATSQKWVNSNASGGSASLAGLDDVSLSSPTNGQVLKYNSTSQEWENANESGGGSGDYIGLYGDTLVGSDLNNITSVGNYYNDGTVTVSHYPSNAIITATSSFRLTVEKMGDSASTNLRQTYVLDNSVDFVFERHRTSGNWSSWQKVLTSYSNIGELDNVSISSPANNQVLTYNSTTQKWENANAQGGGGDYVGLYGMTEIQSSDGQGTTAVDLNDYTTVGNYYCNGKALIQFRYYQYVGDPTGYQVYGRPSAVFLLYVRKISDTYIIQTLYVNNSGSLVKFERPGNYNGSTWVFTYWSIPIKRGSNYGGQPLQLNNYAFADVYVNSRETNDVLVYDKTLTRWENKPLSGYISNPNLLDNPWFTINQRGQSSYSGSIQYTVDRWKILSSAGTLTVNSDGSITVTTTGECWLVQYLPLDVLERLKGKTITLSIDAEKSGGSSNVYSGYSTQSSGWQRISNDVALPTTRGIVSRTATIPTSLVGTPTIYEAFGIYIGANISVTIYSTKIEVGSISTLALDTAPNYATELLKCQRYFVRYRVPYSYYVFGMLFAQSATSMRGNIFLPSSMRTTPSITFSGAIRFLYGSNSSSENISSIAIQGISSNDAFIACTIANNVVVGTVGQLQANNDTFAYIDFTADL